LEADRVREIERGSFTWAWARACARVVSPRLLCLCVAAFWPAGVRWGPWMMAPPDAHREASRPTTTGVPRKPRCDRGVKRGPRRVRRPEDRCPAITRAGRQCLRKRPGYRHPYCEQHERMRREAEPQ